MASKYTTLPPAPASPGTSIGIQRLISLDRVSISQKVTMFANKYAVTTECGELLFHVKEDASALGAMFGGSRRGFHMDIYDANDMLVITLRRPYTFGTSKLEVTVCGVLASVVRQEATLMKPVLSIRDASDNPVLRVKGPASVAGECDFELQTVDKRRIGFISKKWSGLMQEMLTRSDQFDISFPKDLDVRFKAAAIGTCLLIDFLYYEKNR